MISLSEFFADVVGVSVVVMYLQNLIWLNPRWLL